ncbi:MAG TPA: hypothetical protein ENJ95_19905 [Bacteroidetes bacterium]|nr:hypothetical protein [Bacteroidota bacterium]
MKKTGLIILSLFIGGFMGLYSFQKKDHNIADPNILSYIIDPTTQRIQFFWKNKNQEKIKNFKNLKSALEQENKNLFFAITWVAC